MKRHPCWTGSATGIMSKPVRAEVWLLRLDPTLGREQRGVRPCLVVSATLFNHGPAGLAVVVPLTSTDRKIPSHVRIDPPEGGLKQPSFAMCEAIRSVSTSDRFVKRWGTVERGTMRKVEIRLRYLLDL